MSWALILTILTSAFVGYSIISTGFLRAILSDQEGRNDYAQRIRNSRYIEVYKRLLQGGLTAVDWLFGGVKPFRLSGYVACTIISFAYSLFGFILACCLGGPGSIGNTVLLPETWDLTERAQFAAALGVCCLVLYLFTAYPLVLLQYLRDGFMKALGLTIGGQPLLAIPVILIEIFGVYHYADAGLAILSAIAMTTIGVWFSSMLLFGGAAIGSLAALFSGVATGGVHRFLAAIAILAIVAMGASYGTRPVASLAILRARAFFARNQSGRPLTVVGPRFDAVMWTTVFAVVGATGGAAFIAAGARTYAYLVGPELDAALLLSLGVHSHSPWLPLAGATAGFIGGVFASRLGQGAILASGFISALLLILLGARVLSDFKLYEYFGFGSLIGAALVNMLLFFVILPPINAFWDWLAWEVSRLLARKLLVRVNPFKILKQTIIAAFVGLMLLIGLICSMTYAITWFNNWMLAHANTQPLPLNGLIAAMAQNPVSPEGIWITIMLLSTLLPTFFHLLFLLWGGLLIVTPQSWRMAMAAKLDQSTGPIERHWPVLLYIIYVPVIAAVAACALLYMAYLIIFSVMGASLSRMLFWLVMHSTA